MLSRDVFRKSTLSGGKCLEAGIFSRSTLCGDSSCVEAGVFKTSTLSGTGGTCVEVGGDADVDVIMVRDTKDPHGATLSFDREEWEAFIGGVKLGEFDLP